METETLESVIAELRSDNWLTAGAAARKLRAFGPERVAALPDLFKLTCHTKIPLAATSRRILTTYGRLAVPFLCKQVHHCDPWYRAEAIVLLEMAGDRTPTTTRVVEQRLRDRREDLPDWGVDSEVIFELFAASLNDRSLRVRFRAASALEEFGQRIDETVPVFIETLRNGRPQDMNWAALRLGRIGPPAIAAVNALSATTESPCGKTQLAAWNALMWVRGDAIRPTDADAAY